MIGRFLALALAAIGAAASSLVDRDATVMQSGNTITLSGVSSGEVIIIQTNPGGGAGWTNVNPTVAMPGQTHMVVVGGSAGLVYTPNTVNAAVGDIIEFQFMAKNHTVTQSSFTEPCVNAKMFDTGFVPNPMDMSPPPAMRVQVNVTTPTWFYCRQKGHCGEGMVFSVNPTATKTQAAFQAAAIAQNGTAGAASPAAPPVAGATYTSTTGTPAAAASPSVASGTGSTGADGSCSCSCLCGSTSFGSGSMGSFGGFGGMLSPAPATS